MFDVEQMLAEYHSLAVNVAGRSTLLYARPLCDISLL